MRFNPGTELTPASTTVGGAVNAGTRWRTVICTTCDLLGLDHCPPTSSVRALDFEDDLDEQQQLQNLTEQAQWHSPPVLVDGAVESVLRTRLRGRSPWDEPHVEPTAGLGVFASRS